MTNSSKFTGCLLGQAVADALGAPFEGVPADYIFWTQGPIRDLLIRPSPKPLRYTDDTQMMIGVAESLIIDGEIRGDELLRRFVVNYEAGRGYGQGARTILEAAQAGEPVEELVTSLFPGGSYGNGAAMRVAPVGLFFHDDLDRVADQAKLSAWPTHRHPLGIEGARLFAVAVSLAVREFPLDRKDFYRELRHYSECEEFDWQLRAARRLKKGDSVNFLGNSLPAHRSVITAIACFTMYPESFSDAVTEAISLGDDTDTIAAMAGALCGAHCGLAAIPVAWLDRLEDGARGREYIRSLARKLSQKRQ